MTAADASQKTVTETVGDRELRLTRLIDAPREAVWEAWTVPELLKRWGLGPRGWTMKTCDIDFRPGGTWRFVLQHAQIAIYGNAADKIVCPAALVVAATTGLMRIVSDRHWASDVIAGASFGLAWVALVSLVCTHRAVGEDLAPRRLAALAVVVIAVALPLWNHWHGPADRRLYALQPAPLQVMSALIV